MTDIKDLVDDSDYKIRKMVPVEVKIEDEPMLQKALASGNSAVDQLVSVAERMANDYSPTEIIVRTPKNYRLKADTGFLGLVDVITAKYK